MNFDKPNTITKTTLNLTAGDKVLTGNCILGFWSFQIVAVDPNANNKRMAILTVRFDHGGEVKMVEGKNARWDVVA